MKKKNLLILTLGAVMALTSCKKHANEVDQTLPEDDPTSPVTITFWSCLGHEKGNNFGKIVDKFNETYAGKYNVQVDKIAGSYDALHDAIKTKVAAGEIPAMTMGYPDSFSEYITKYIEDSQILRLDNFIKDANFGYTEAELADFVPGYYNEGNNYQFEGVWSMPMYKSTEVMYYNYSYFMGVNDVNSILLGGDDAFMALYNAATGNTATEESLLAVKNYAAAHGGKVYEVPQTWTQMLTIARQMMADRAAIPALAGSTFFPVGYDSDANLMISQMKQRGIAYTVNDDASKENAALHFQFNNAQAKALVGELAGLLNEKLLITKGSLGGGTYTNTYFNNGQSVMSIGSTGGSSYQISSNFVVKIAPVPYSGSTPYYIQQGPSICFFNNDNSYVHKGAWLFYKMLAETDNNTALALENSYDPVRKSCYNTQAYKDWIAMAGQGLKYDIPAQTSKLTSYYMTSPVFIGSGTARNEIGNILAYHYLGNKTIDQAFEQAYNICVQAA